MGGEGASSRGIGTGIVSRRTTIRAAVRRRVIPDLSIGIFSGDFYYVLIPYIWLSIHLTTESTATTGLAPGLSGPRLVLFGPAENVTFELSPNCLIDYLSKLTFADVTTGLSIAFIISVRLILFSPFNCTHISYIYNLNILILIS